MVVIYTAIKLLKKQIQQFHGTGQLYSVKINDNQKLKV